MNTIKLITVVSLLVLAATATATQAEAGKVDGWFQAGTDFDGYTIGTETMDDGVVAYIKSLEPAKDKFGTLMQSFSPEQYLGKRIQMTASIKTVDVKTRAAMWMRVDEDKKMVSFDNMNDRPIKGSSDWQTYTIVLDVPESSTGISMGIILKGHGEAYWDNIIIETVSQNVPITDIYKMKSEPSNLNFSK